MENAATSRQRARPPLNHSRRTWNDNGVQYTVESSSYASPSLSFQFQSGTSASTLPSRNQRSQSSGLLGTAFSLLGDVLTLQQQQQQSQVLAQGTRRSQRSQSYAEGQAYGDKRKETDGRKPKTLFGNLADKLLSGQQQRQQQATRSRDTSPVRRRGRHSGNDGKWRSQQERRPAGRATRTAYVEEDTDSEEDDRYSDSHSDNEFAEEAAFTRRKPQRAFTSGDVSAIQELEDVVEHARREAKKCKKQIESASRRPGTNAAVLQNLLNDLQRHEKAHEAATEELRTLKGGTKGRRSAQRTARSQRSPMPDRSADDFEPSSQTRRNTDAGVDPFEELFNMAHSFAASHPFFEGGRGTGDPIADAFFAGPRAAYTFSGTSSSRPRTQRTQTRPQPQAVPLFDPFSSPPAPRPPATLLKPEEAKRLFKTYNERWNSLQPTDFNVPYPTRGLKASALLARDSIWAPSVSSPVSTWSEETIMQANAQAFYLGVVGLKAQYTETMPTGRLAMGYNKAKATPEQTKELIDLLKKEKLRWHSDRLGRRNGGVAGTNEALQCDDRARAVFHAVVELMSVAQDAQGD